MLKILGFVAIALLFLLFAAIGILYVTRGTPLSRVSAVGHREASPLTVGDSQFLWTLELLGKLALTPGNAVEVLHNGDETYPRLWEDLRAARRSLTLQFYYMNPGSLADTLQAILIDRARAGVHVLLLIDAFGAAKIDDDYLDRLREAGVHVAIFRPMRWYKMHKASHRSHIRVVVIDGETAYTGGFGIDDKWLGDGRREGQWRETNVRFRGPAVSQLQATFAAGWVEATGTLLIGDAFFPRREFIEEDGAMRAAVLHAAPTIGSTAAERFLALTIVGASRLLYVSNSYFVPDDDFRRLLGEVARRGVDVRVLTASEKSDITTTWLAGRYKYEELLRAGVRIYEYQPAMMHAKTIVVDGMFSSIGTMNIDNRSLSFNDESNLIAVGPGVGGVLVEAFLEDLRYAREIRLEEWERRPWTEKVKEWGAHMVSRLL